MSNTIGCCRPALHDVFARHKCYNERWRQHRVRCASEGSSDIQKHEGTWVGTSASFGKNGRPLLLPHSVTPPQYTEWGIELRDWSTVTCVKRKEDSLLLSTKFMIPTVGCEPDGVNFAGDARLYRSSGLPTSEDCQAFNHKGPLGLMRENENILLGTPHSLGEARKTSMDTLFTVNPTQRVRVRVHLERWDVSRPWSLQEIDLIKEAFAGQIEIDHESLNLTVPSAELLSRAVISQPTVQALTAVSPAPRENNGDEIEEYESDAGLLITIKNLLIVLSPTYTRI